MISEEGDIVTAVEGDMCPDCGRPMYVKKGIEVGHIFKLGYKYTKGMNFTVLDKNGKAVNPIMGCYGIGVTRTLAAIIEHNYDEKGLKWPKSVAPFDVHIVGIYKTPEEEAKVVEVYDLVKSCGLDPLFDDRKLSPGIKFADADLIGLPLRITVGKNFFESKEVEALDRASGEVSKIALADLSSFLKKFFERG